MARRYSGEDLSSGQLRAIFAKGNNEVIRKNRALKRNSPNPPPKSFPRNPPRIRVVKGKLGGPGFFDMPVTVRRRQESKLAHKEGEKVVIGRLRAIHIFNKSAKKGSHRRVVADRAAADAKFIAGTFEGKKRVGYPDGFVRRPK